MYCATCAPAVITTDMARVVPSPRSSSACDPAESDTDIGVTPRSVPSTNTFAPTGLVLTTSIPRAALASVTATGVVRRAATTPAPAAAINAAAAAIAGQRMRRNARRDGASTAMRLAATGAGIGAWNGGWIGTAAGFWNAAGWL